MNIIELIIFAVSFLSSVIGAICGIGGGVIIKPVLDAIGVMQVSSISFLSGCTVLSMSVVSVYKDLKYKNVESEIDLKMGTPLALGAAFGGIAGKELFQYFCKFYSNENKVGAIQAIVLLFITVGTLIYTLLKSKIKTWMVTNFAIITLLGFTLGSLSSFLGIGGGPINLVVLGFFFSMGIKQAAANSLYIIMISQITSLLSTLIFGKIPDFKLLFLVLMVIGGIIGGNVGNKIHKKIESKQVNKLFIILMGVIICINLYNVWKFSI